MCTRTAIIVLVSFFACAPILGFITTYDQLRCTGKVVTLLGDIHQHPADSTCVEKQLSVLRDFCQLIKNPLFLVEYAPRSSFVLFIRQLWESLEDDHIAHIDIEVRPKAYLAALDAINWAEKLNQDVSLEDTPEEIERALNQAAFNVCHAGINGIDAPPACQRAYESLSAALKAIPKQAQTIVRFAPGETAYLYALDDFIATPDQLVEIEALKHILLTPAQHIFIVAGAAHIKAIIKLLEQEGFVHMGHKGYYNGQSPLSSEELAQALAANF